MHPKEAKVGDEITLKKEVDKYRPIFYAGASGDFNPIHIDPEFGKMVGLGGNILQGLCTMAYCQQLVTDWIGDPGLLKRLKVRFAGNVKPGDTVTLKGVVKEKQEKKIVLDIVATIQDGSVVISNAEADISLE